MDDQESQERTRRVKQRVTSITQLVDSLKNRPINADGSILMPMGAAVDLSQIHVLLVASLKFHGLLGKGPPKNCGCASEVGAVSNNRVTVIQKPPFEYTTFFCKQADVEMTYAVSSPAMVAKMKDDGFHQVKMTYYNNESADFVGLSVASIAPILAPNLFGFGMNDPSMDSLPTQQTIGSSLSLALAGHVVDSVVEPSVVEPIGQKTRLSLSKALQDKVYMCDDISVLHFANGKPAVERVLMLWELHTCAPRFREGIDGYYSPLIHWSLANIGTIFKSSDSDKRDRLNNKIFYLAQIYLYLVSLGPELLSSQDQKSKMYSTLREDAKLHFRSVEAVKGFSYFDQAKETAILRQNEIL